LVKGGLVKSEDGWEAVSNEGTAFEIGSVTKLYTAYIVAQLVSSEQIQLDEPIGQYVEGLASNEANPSLADITFEALLTHTSGLTFLPSELTDMPVTNSNPLAGYTGERLHSYLKLHATPLESNPEYIYSNLGYAVLGLALESASGKSYAELLDKHVIAPYALQHTSLQRNELEPALIKGQNFDGTAAEYWDFDAFQSSGGIYSSLDDVVTFIRGQLDPANSAAALMREQHHPAAGLGWAFQQGNVTNWLEQTGATGGFTSAVLIQPEWGKGVVVLSNLSGLHPHAHNVAKLAEWLLNADCSASPSTEL
ncbi:MAG: beta-lactamase family protein, partial [Idiomarina sp.]|nr:beta-lactamase family protein [Idiomarina sp.]